MCYGNLVQSQLSKIPCDVFQAEYTRQKKKTQNKRLSACTKSCWCRFVFCVSVSKWWFIISISWRHWVPFESFRTRQAWILLGIGCCFFYFQKNLYNIIIIIIIHIINIICLISSSNSTSSSTDVIQLLFFCWYISDQINTIKYINALRARLSSSALIEKNSKNPLGHHNWFTRTVFFRLLFFPLFLLFSHSIHCHCCCSSDFCSWRNAFEWWWRSVN